MANPCPETYKKRVVDPYVDELLTQLPALLVIGPRAVGKSTTIARRARSIIRLDREGEAAAFVADPDAALRGLAEPVLLDEWQVVPGVLGAVRRSIEADRRPNRFLVTGSVRAELDNAVWPGTGRLTRVAMYPMSIREQRGLATGGTFFDKLAHGEQLSVPAAPPDLRGYVELALRSGFPDPALHLSGKPREVWLESYIEDLLTHDVEQLEDTRTKRHDRRLLRNYFEAYALNSAGIAQHKTIFGAAKLDRKTADRYESLLTDLLVVEQIPSWRSNRLRRLVHQPKRYLIDPALIATALRLDVQGVLGDGDLLGRVLDTFVAAQLRPQLAPSDTRPRLYHLRTEGGRQEVDLLAELAGQRVIGMEVKAGAAPERVDAKHLIWLRDKIGGRFVAGIVFHTGPRLFELDEGIIAAPIAALWG